MQTAFIIVSAGKGTRAGQDTPKQYQRIAGKSVISRTLQHFKALGPIVVVINPADRTIFDDSVADIDPKLRQSLIIAHGGATRTESVKGGLTALKSTRPDYVLIHDAARPFVSQDVISDVIGALSSHQAAVPVLPIVDAVKTTIGDSVERETLRRVQTPQGFHFNDIFTAYAALSPSDSFADDIAVARHAGLSIKMTQGHEANIKLTYPKDFKQAEARMSDANNLNTFCITGTGFDVHRLVERKGDDDAMWLCGVKIDGPLTLLGHSDADAGLHAITDAILGAVALGDIGDHFPPSDARWRGASSDIFLAHAIDLAKAESAELVHVDVTLICERPKIKPHRQAMRERIAELTRLPLSRVSVKATTTEGLGFTGRTEGLAAQAAVTLAIPAK